MKVNPAASNAIEKTKDSTATNRAGEAQTSKNKRKQSLFAGGANYEKVDISSGAKQAAKAKEIASNAPDVREERVAQLREAIQKGTYKVDTDAVAEKMLAEHMR
mgnify:CR=1 FL=1